jgi:hypothetical protein
VRGENLDGLSTISATQETPPRAWGKSQGDAEALEKARNTPTCVGKMPEQYEILDPSRKHPHVRGENATSLGSEVPAAETPPRAWGKYQHLVKEHRATPVFWDYLISRVSITNCKPLIAVMDLRVGPIVRTS